MVTKRNGGEARMGEEEQERSGSRARVVRCGGKRWAATIWKGNGSIATYKSRGIGRNFELIMHKSHRIGIGIRPKPQPSPYSSIWRPAPIPAIASNPATSSPVLFLPTSTSASAPASPISALLSSKNRLVRPSINRLLCSRPLSQSTFSSAPGRD